MKKILIFTLTIFLFSSCTIIGVLKMRKMIDKTTTVPTNTVIKFRLDRGHIKIPVQLDNKISCELIYDTGAAVSVIDKGYSKKILNKKNIIKSNKIGIFYLDSIKIANKIELIKPLFFKMDLSGLIRDSTTCGILGTNINHLFYTKISYEDTTIQFSTEPILKKEPIKPIKFIQNAKGKIAENVYNICIPLTVGDSTYKTVFDTGNNTAFLVNLKDKEKEDISKFSITKKYNTYGSYADVHGKFDTIMVNEKIQADLAVGYFKMGKFMMETGVYRSNKKETKETKDLLSVGAMGYKVLRNFNIYIDWKNNDLYIDKNKYYKENTTFPEINIGEKDKVFLVSSILIASFWDKNGLEVKSTVSEINGKNVKDITKSELDNLNENQSIYSLKFINRKGEEKILNKEKNK